MAKREREEEFEVSEVAPLQPLSLASLLLDPTVACTLHFQCYTVQRSLPISVLYYNYI